MPMNSTLKARFQKSEREARFARRVKSMCQPAERTGLYDVVSKFDGTVISRSVPMEAFLEYGEAMRGYHLIPCNMEVG